MNNEFSFNDRSKANFIAIISLMLLVHVPLCIGKVINKKASSKQTVQSKDSYPTSLIERMQKRRISTRSSSGNSDMGWIPIEFPDPRTDFKECRIANIVASEIAMNDHEDTPAAGKAEQLEFLFCDPDIILSDDRVREVSEALGFFKAKYAQNITKEDLSDPEEDQQDIFGETFASDSPRLQPEIAVAVTSRMDINNILHDFAFYTFEDEEDMINDAAMYFANYLHNRWFTGYQDNTGHVAHRIRHMYDKEDKKRDMNASDEAREANGILIFMSVADRICFISSGNGISAVLPWWRLEKVVSDMNAFMRNDEYFNAIIGAIDDISMMLDEGPPTATEKVGDFLSRFGVFILFSIITFLMALNGEYRDRQMRYEDAELVSEMDHVERQKAKQKLKSFQTKSCPICLESFDYPSENEGERDSECQKMMPRVDSFGIAIYGSDGEKLKILRCGHAFDASCWRFWISSPSCTDPGLCPVCRTDITKSREEISTESFIEDDETISYGTFHDLWSTDIDGEDGD